MVWNPTFTPSLHYADFKTDIHVFQGYRQFFNLNNCHVSLNNIGHIKRTLQYYYHATPGEPRVLLGLHGDSTEGFLLKNLYCLECSVSLQSFGAGNCI